MITPGRKKIENVPPRSQIALALHIDDRLFDTLLTATSMTCPPFKFPRITLHNTDAQCAAERIVPDSRPIALS